MLCYYGCWVEGNEVWWPGVSLQCKCVHRWRSNYSWEWSQTLGRQVLCKVHSFFCTRSRHARAFNVAHSPDRAMPENQCTVERARSTWTVGWNPHGFRCEQITLAASFNLILSSQSHHRYSAVLECLILSGKFDPWSVLAQNVLAPPSCRYCFELIGRSLDHDDVPIRGFSDILWIDTCSLSLAKFLNFPFGKPKSSRVTKPPVLRLHTRLDCQLMSFWIRLLRWRYLSVMWSIVTDTRLDCWSKSTLGVLCVFLAWYAWYGTSQMC